jgi:hypothetical protein
MPKTKRKTPSPNRKFTIRRNGLFDSPVKAVRRSSPLWKQNAQKVVRWSPQPQPPLMSSPELVKTQHEKWKDDQDKLRRAANVTRRQKIQKNRELGIYEPPESIDQHNFVSDQKVATFWNNAQNTIETDMAWASDDPPLHFGGRKRKMKRLLRS